MNKIAIIGLGLIGGSLALSLRKAGFYVVGIARRGETVEKAKNSGAIDEGSCDIKDISDADFVFICTPISLIIPILKETTPYLKKGAIVSDVGSTKQEIVSQAENLMPKGRYFVGGHPMTGKEKVKFEEAEDGLFKDKIWMLIKTSKTRTNAISRLENIILTTGAKILYLDPKKHDLVVAAISHMPLAVAVSLINTVESQTEKTLMLYCAASGFRDTTRIASGDPLLGVDMFMTNKKAVLRMIKAFKVSLATLEKLIKKEEIDAVKKELERAKTARDGSPS